ncbi:hypothetical protein P280DRAFT_72012 [Massarina eburnea CBS 473.64]|uniref:Uncharacterized protein n=1 Tax=Massarina eburnea CBS 473.64 TaxID=1395130 RepID=A0A6A6RT09_9PLEO|nr:hypothetical protein P280DRAFT_72012 [Massarina eburnea CBS 473.64]
MRGKRRILTAIVQPSPYTTQLYHRQITPLHFANTTGGLVRLSWTVSYQLFYEFCLLLLQCVLRPSHQIMAFGSVYSVYCLLCIKYGMTFCKPSLRPWSWKLLGQNAPRIIGTSSAPRDLPGTALAHMRLFQRKFSFHSAAMEEVSVAHFTPRYMFLLL